MTTPLDDPRSDLRYPRDPPTPDARAAARIDYQLRRLRLRHLQLLVQLDAVGTLRGAAQRLHLTQPAVSKMLVEAEAAFGMPLFTRSRQGMRANEAGLAATRHARAVLHTLARADGELQALSAGATALLRIGTPAVTATVPAAIVALQRRHPGLAVRLREGRAQELVQRLLDGELDAVVGTVTAELLAEGAARRLRSRTLGDDHLCVLAASGHPLQRRRSLGWAELHGARWVTAPPDTLVGQAFHTAYLQAGLAPPQPVVETQSAATLGALLRLEPGLLGAVRHEHARDELARGGLRLLPVAPVLRLPPLALLTRDEPSAADPALQALADALQAVGGAVKPARATPRS